MPDDVPAVMMPGCPSTSPNTERQLAQALDRRVGARMLVGGRASGRACPCASVNVTGAISSREVSGRRSPRFALRWLSSAKRVRLLARDAVLAREHLGRLAHDQVRQRSTEAVAIHRVDEREVAHPWPQRASSASIRYGMRLIDSMPPASTISDSPSMIDCAPVAIACRPDAHALLIVCAGACPGMPARMADLTAPGWGRSRPAGRGRPALVDCWPVRARRRERGSRQPGAKLGRVNVFKDPP